MYGFLRLSLPSLHPAAPEPHTPKLAAHLSSSSRSRHRTSRAGWKSRSRQRTARTGRTLPYHDLHHRASSSRWSTRSSTGRCSQASRAFSSARCLLSRFLCHCLDHCREPLSVPGVSSLRGRASPASRSSEVAAPDPDAAAAFHGAGRSRATRRGVASSRSDEPMPRLLGMATFARNGLSAGLAQN